MRVNEYLEQEIPENERKISQETIAELLGVSPRTIYNWRRTGPAKKLGRPCHSKAVRRQALWRVGRELRRQRYPGWRAISKGLEGAVPDRLVQEYVRRFKQRRRRRLDAERRRIRASMEVQSPNVVWSLDAAHFPRGQQAQVTRDRGSRKFVATNVGPPVRSQDVLQLLEALKRTRGLPLVLSTDNGAPFVHRDVVRFLERERVVHLRSLPGTPEHNSAVEVSIRELREQVGDDASRLVEAATLLNRNRLRASLGYQTADAVDARWKSDYNQVREDFYRSCTSNMQRATKDAQSARQSRMLEREAIHATLEQRGWIKRWRGGHPICSTRPETIS